MTTLQATKYGVKEIADLFPSLMKIKDESLREKVAAVWNEAITTGCGGKGWTFDELRAVKFTLLAGDNDMTFVDHLNSCARQCIAISEVLGSAFSCDIPVQLDHLIAGSLLADVGKPLEFDKDVSGNLQNTLAANLHLHRCAFRSMSSSKVEESMTHDRPSPQNLL